MPYFYKELSYCQQAIDEVPYVEDLMARFKTLSKDRKPVDLTRVIGMWLPGSTLVLPGEKDLFVFLFGSVENDEVTITRRSSDDSHRPRSQKIKMHDGDLMVLSTPHAWDRFTGVEREAEDVDVFVEANKTSEQACLLIFYEESEVRGSEEYDVPGYHTAVPATLDKIHVEEVRHFLGTERPTLDGLYTHFGKERLWSKLIMDMTERIVFYGSERVQLFKKRTRTPISKDVEMSKGVPRTIEDLVKEDAPQLVLDTFANPDTRTFEYLFLNASPKKDQSMVRFEIVAHTWLEKEFPGALKRCTCSLTSNHTLYSKVARSRRFDLLRMDVQRHDTGDVAAAMTPRAPR